MLKARLLLYFISLFCVYSVWYYEVVVITPGRATIGWADNKFQANFFTGVGVGDNEHSWGFDGNNAKKEHAGVKESWGFAWSSGDVIGCVANVDTGEISYSYNGSWEQPMGEACFSFLYVAIN
jgi:hypothetical protein